MGSPPPEGIEGLHQGPTAADQGPAATSQDPAAPGGETGVENGNKSSPLPLRRSGRARKRPSDQSEPADPEVVPSTTSPVSTENRRNQKRKAAPESFDIPDDLLEASLGPWGENEQSEWPSWIELESDPAFFSAILGLLGVKGARIEEVLSADEDSLAMLPPPVYGLVFLYEYVAENSDQSSTPSEDVWFANQTTDNACATIALLNIIMNAEGLGLGDKLRRLKQESKDLSPPLRGNMISNSAWIRTAHNSFARRLDFLNAALSLQNDVDSSRKKRAKSSAKQKRKEKREQAKETRSGGSTAYHFIAFVPVGQQVWQLDGLTSAPVCIGEYSEDQHWTAVMHPVLQERMMRYETERLSFSLLALCGDNLAPVRQKLADNIRSLAELEAKLKDSQNNGDNDTSNNPDLESKTKQDIIHSPTDSRLATYQLDAEDILAAAAASSTEPNPPEQPDPASATAPTPSPCEPNPPKQDSPTSPTSPPKQDDPAPSTEPTSSPPNPTKQDSTPRSWTTLAAAQRLLTAQYDRESKVAGLAGQDPAAILGRTRDYTGAVHEWVRKLAERGVLRRLCEEVEMGGG